jgi:hypothetical protein
MHGTEIIKILVAIDVKKILSSVIFNHTLRRLYDKKVVETDTE